MLRFRRVAQLVEYRLDTARVSGSSPLAPTKNNLAAYAVENSMSTYPTKCPTNSVKILRKQQTLRTATFGYFLMFLKMLRDLEGKISD